jgi:hypothetical protein
VSPKHFSVGLDLGQSSDYSALAILEDISEPTNSKHKTLHLRSLERFQLPYPEVVRRVKARMEHPLLKERAALAVDGTGVGRGVVDMMREEGEEGKPRLFALNQNFYPVLITGGDRSHYDKGFWRVPKRDLVFGAPVALEQGRLKFAKGLPELPTLVEELRNFRLKIDPRTAHDSYSHWRENQHDDLVLAVALAVWAAGKAGTTSSPILLRRSSYWKGLNDSALGANAQEEMVRAPVAGQDGWYQTATDVDLNVFRKG